MRERSRYVTEEEVRSGAQLDLVVRDLDGSTQTLAEWAGKDGYEGVTVAGIMVVARDSGAFVMAQRAMDPTDAPEVAETWEFPGGHLNPGEDPLAGAMREFEEEVGTPVPEGEVVFGWRAGPEDNYQGFVYEVAEQFAIDPANCDPDEVQNVLWATVEGAATLNLRPEVAKLDLAGLVSGNEDTMTEMAAETEPEFDVMALVEGPIPIHGVIAPEEAASGDGRAFAEGALTSRPLRIPFRWQKSDIGGHDGAVVVGSVDRLMRKDGLIHWEGLMMSTCEADELTDLIEFFRRFGVSVDGDKGSLDEARSKQTGMTWFDAVRAAGLTAVAIPAFSEAYVALGPHPDMPEEMEDTVLTAGACSPTLLSFKRGPGWVTNPKETNRLHDYWTKKGEPGYSKIGWGTPGDFRRAKALIGEKIAKNSPEKMKYLNQIIAQWHHDALGYWPGDTGKPGNAPEASLSNVDNEGIEATDEGWEAVLVSSITGQRVAPPLEYFHRHEDAGALVIEDPDANGIVRTYGYAGEWGVCHIGMGNRCVEPPRTFSDDYPEFHLGRTKVALDEGEQGYIYTGVLTYGVGHRDAKQILSESPDQAYFDNINNAWAAVRVGEDDRGIWFSGVVLPGVDPDHIVKIEASGQVSGEWLHGAMRACLTVNVPGYAVERPSAEYDDEGNVIALAASAFGGIADAPCDPTPLERMQALALIDAEVRMDRLREQWGA